MEIPPTQLTVEAHPSLKDLTQMTLVEKELFNNLFRHLQGVKVELLQYKQFLMELIQGQLYDLNNALPLSVSTDNLAEAARVVVDLGSVRIRLDWTGWIEPQKRAVLFLRARPIDQI